MFKKNPSITPEIKSSSRILFDEINFNFKLSKKIPGMEEIALQNEILEEIVETMGRNYLGKTVTYITILN